MLADSTYVKFYMITELYILKQKIKAMHSGSDYKSGWTKLFYY